MPVKRRKAKQRREVPDLIRRYFREEVKHTFFYDNAEIAAAWDQIGDEIVADWVRDKPGTRPAVWWRLSAPPPGRTTDGGGGPGRAPECLDIPIAAPPPAQQKRFLKRYDLLLPGEAKRLTEPETTEAPAGPGTGG